MVSSWARRWPRVRNDRGAMVRAGRPQWTEEPLALGGNGIFRVSTQATGKVVWTMNILQKLWRPETPNWGGIRESRW